VQEHSDELPHPQSASGCESGGAGSGADALRGEAVDPARNEFGESGAGCPSGGAGCGLEPPTRLPKSFCSAAGRTFATESTSSGISTPSKAQRDI
jgi:hypothetical protein